MNGCYEVGGSYGTNTLYVLDSGHELYSWDGVWRLGLHGVNVSYTSTMKQDAPPESSGGCGMTSGWVCEGAMGRDPCPAVRRMGLPPTPAPPPTPSPTPQPTPPAPAPSAMRLVWEDEFDSPILNESRWNVLEQVHRGGVYTRDNVRIVDGALVLRTVARNMTIQQGGRPIPFYVASGAVNTSGLLEQRTGRWEARVKLPAVAQSTGYTLHSSIWLFSDTRNPARSGCPQEIDVVEQYAVQTKATVSNAVANLHPFEGNRSSCVKHAYGPYEGTATGDWTSDWTTFTVDWTDKWIAMYVNGKLYANFGANPDAVSKFTDPLFLALTACVMQRTPPVAADNFPLEYKIDRVKVYEWVK